jgi:hypothetical protein
MSRVVTQLHAILGSRKPVVAARLLERRADGAVRAEALAEGEKARRVRAAVERVFRLGAGRLTPEEWAALFAREAPLPPDTRWALLVRLAAEPEGDEGGLRDQFAALPDGTAFSMRLLLLSTQGGARGRAGEGGETGPARGVSFNRLPDVARLIPLVLALRRLGSTTPVTPKQLANLVGREATGLGLPVGGLTAKDVTDRLFRKIRDNGGEAWLPKLAYPGPGRRPRPSEPEGSSDG